MMRILLWLLVLGLPCLGQVVTPGVGAGAVRLGQSDPEVRQALGAPREIRPGSSDTRIYLYDGLMLLLNKEKQVIGLTLSGPGFKTAEKVGVGSSAGEVERAYGAGLRRGEGNLTYPAKGLGFTFDGQGKASHVYVFKPEGDRPLLGDRQIVAGKRAGQLQLGGSAQAVQSAWGAPSKTQDLGGGRSLLTFDKQGIRLMVSGGAIDAILVTTGDFITVEGVKIGATQAEVERAYGSGFQRKGPGLFYAQKGIGFLLGKESVIEIQVLFPR